MGSCRGLGSKVIASFPGSPGTRIFISTPAQLQCSRSGAWEPGNEASKVMSLSALVGLGMRPSHADNILYQIVIVYHGQGERMVTL